MKKTETAVVMISTKTLKKTFVYRLQCFGLCEQWSITNNQFILRQRFSAPMCSRINYISMWKRVLYSAIESLYWKILVYECVCVYLYLNENSLMYFARNV